MNLQFIYPMTALVFLVGITAVTLFIRRISAVRKGEVKASHFKTYNTGTPPVLALQAERHYTNLFELPVIFFVGCLAAMHLPNSSSNPNLTLMSLAWTFVALRYLHAYIHLFGNKLIPRMLSFISGFAVIMAFWVVLALEVLAFTDL